MRAQTELPIYTTNVSNTKKLCEFITKESKRQTKGKVDGFIVALPW